MREPMIRSGRLSRQQRLLRTGIGVVGVVAVAALIANALSGGDSSGPDGEPAVAKVAFAHTTKTTTDAGKPKTAAAKAEADAIVKILNDWYQRGFVDPRLYGDGTFGEIAAHFAKDAKVSFTKDVASLTIGDARTLVARVDPTKAAAGITIFFAKGTKPTFAVAEVVFDATATQKQSGQPNITIKQRGTYHLEKTGNAWKVVYYTATSSEKPVEPTPSGSPSS